MEDVVGFYTDHPDEERLLHGWGLLEFERSKEIVLRHLPGAGQTVLDIGGGTGIYSEWLAGLGHDAHLIDITPSHIGFARGNRERIASAEIGDARQLAWADASADAVLLFGPLYHLVERADRIRGLREAQRVLRPGGLAFVAAICRLAPLLGSLVEGFFDHPAFRPVLARDLQDGQHRNTTGDPRRFTTAYFHRPEELEAEMGEAGFALVEMLPVEGPCWLAHGSRDGFERCWAEPSRRRSLLELARAVERDPLALSLTPHIMAVGRK